MESNSHSEKIVENGNKPFKLWLEFEETSPWDDIKNSFANIGVDTLDGRHYGINVWTFNFLSTAQKEEDEIFIIPPDLFVEELTRGCIEKVIAKLLDEGNLEEVLNESVFDLKFLKPYQDAYKITRKSIQSLMDEFNLELPDNHVLRAEAVDLIAKKENNDDIVLRLGDGRIAIVHLTWKSKKEIEGYPITKIYKDELDFWIREMKQDIIEFKE